MGPKAGAQFSAGPLAVTEISAAKGLVPLNLRELWEYRELLLFFVWRDIKGQYKQTAFGPLWMIVTPLLAMVINTVIFSKVAKLSSDGIPYPLFNYCALLPWGFFSGGLMSAAGSLLGYKDLISKVYFPRLIVPIVGILSGLVNFVISFLILVAMMLYYGYSLTWGVCLVPLFLLLAALTSLSVGLWWASWVVQYRDLSNVLSYVLRFWMYATPVVYATSVVPEEWRALYRLNPMTPVIEGFRWCLLGVGDPPGVALLVPIVFVMCLLVSGACYFRKTEKNIVDVS